MVYLRSVNITYQDLASRFHLPSKAAAEDLGICTTLLKKLCRKFGIPRWPHRKLKSIELQLKLDPHSKELLEKRRRILITPSSIVTRTPASRISLPLSPHAAMRQRTNQGIKPTPNVFLSTLQAHASHVMDNLHADIPQATPTSSAAIDDSSPYTFFQVWQSKVTIPSSSIPHTSSFPTAGAFTLISEKPLNPWQPRNSLIRSDSN